MGEEKRIRSTKRKTNWHVANSNGYIRDEEAYARERKAEVEARDNIVAISYAERQIADSLKKAGKVKTEL